MNNTIKFNGKTIQEWFNHTDVEVVTTEPIFIGPVNEPKPPQPTLNPDIKNPLAHMVKLHLIADPDAPDPKAEIKQAITTARNAVKGMAASNANRKAVEALATALETTI